MIEIRQIPVLHDNYVYLVHLPDSGHTLAVDPAVAEPILTELAEAGWTLTHILNTHHHHDHIGGNAQLKQITRCVIVGSEQDAARILGLDLAVKEGDSFHIGTTEIRVMDVSGHTCGHIAYWLPTAQSVFVGDTVFSLGCGRLFEGTPSMMWASLAKIRSLPDSTRIYCAHEYTEANARFALSVEPDNVDLCRRVDEVAHLRRQGLPTVPSTVALERACNPFLRPDSASIRTRLGLMEADDVTVFTELRHRKDVF